MRAPRRKRPLCRRVVGTVTGRNMADVAEHVRYIGSAEHKDTPSFAGRLRPRADASLCPRELVHELERVTQWLRSAIARGAVGELWEGEFPRYAWHKEGSVVYEARLVNRDLGEYKGYPLDETEWPDGLDSVNE